MDPYKVFVSHQSEDSASAKKVARRLAENGLRYYLDVVDSALVQDGPLLAEYIHKQMSDWAHLIAVVSTNTEGPCGCPRK